MVWPLPVRAMQEWLKPTSARLCSPANPSRFRGDGL